MILEKLTDLWELHLEQEPQLKIFISILIGYLIAAWHRCKFHRRSATIHHLYFLVCGLLLGYYAFGTSILHCFVATCLTYLILLFTNGKTLIIITGLFNIGYLLIGYYFDQGNYVWTLPQSILCLRLIGLSFDLYDSFCMSITKRSRISRKWNTLIHKPTFLQLLSYTFFPTTFIIGPQISMGRYLRFINDDLDRNCLRRCRRYCFYVFKLGVLYLVMGDLGCWIIPNDFLISYNFLNMMLPLRLLYLGVWSRFFLYKYIGLWMINEGSSILMGLSNNGNGEWNGCEMVNVRKFERATTVSGFLTSFNSNLHIWFSEYVYQRLKFISNAETQVTRQLLTLFSLALWHGFDTGYYLTFLIIFANLHFEKELKVIMNQCPYLRGYINQAIILPVIGLLQRVYSITMLGFVLIPYVFRDQSKYRIALYNTNYIGCYLLFLWPIYRPVVKTFLKYIDSRIAKQVEKDGIDTGDPYTQFKSLKVTEQTNQVADYLENSTKPIEKHNDLLHTLTNEKDIPLNFENTLQDLIMISNCSTSCETADLSTVDDRPKSLNSTSTVLDEDKFRNYSDSFQEVPSDLVFDDQSFESRNMIYAKSVAHTEMALLSNIPGKFSDYVKNKR